MRWGLWTGWTDIALSPEGEKEAEKAAEQLRDFDIHKAHTSKLQRATQTLDIIKHALKLSHIPTEAHEALNEKSYGIFTGKNKWQVKEEVGEEEFQKIRRAWDRPIPEGETLKDVHARVVPYYEQHILEDLKAGKNVIVVAHGNSLRALVKHLDQLSDKDVEDLEVGLAEAHVYQIDENGKVLSKEIRSENPNKGKI